MYNIYRLPTTPDMNTAPPINHLKSPGFQAAAQWLHERGLLKCPQSLAAIGATNPKVDRTARHCSPQARPGSQKYKPRW